MKTQHICNFILDLPEDYWFDDKLFKEYMQRNASYFIVNPDKPVIRPSLKEFINISQNPFPVCAEIGVWKGEYSKTILTVMPSCKLYLIDGYTNTTTATYYPPEQEVFTNTLIKEMQERLEPFKDRYVWVRKNSDEAVNDFPDEFFDFVYVDGDHEYKQVKRDIENYFKKLKPGGVMGGHDIPMEEVKKAYREFIVENASLIERCGELYGGENREVFGDFYIQKIQDVVG